MEQEVCPAHRPNRTRRALLAAAAMLLSAGPAAAQVPTGAAAPSAPMSPTGGYAASIALDLPASRSGLPLPLSVTYTGLTRAGAAGSGWDVPISYVAWQRPQRNRPKVAGDGRETPPRLMMSMGGGPMLMVPVDGAATRYVPHVADTYLELSRDHTDWVLRTLANREYRFEPVSLIENRAWGQDSAYDDLWVLTEIRDTVSGDRVAIRYDATPVGTCAPDLRIRSLTYTFDGANRPLHEIELVHEPWWRPDLAPGWLPYLDAIDPRTCAFRNGEHGTERAFLLDHSVDDHVPTERTTILREIRIRSRDNLDPASSPKTVRTYQLGYEPDPDTDKPRLTTAQLIGEDGVTRLPLARYAYGALTAGASPPTVSFGLPVEIARSPQLPAQFRDSVGDTAESREATTDDGDALSRETVRATHLIRDLTGDGIPDEAWKQGDTWHVAAGRLTDHGVALDGPISTWSEPVELFEQTTFRRVVGQLNTDYTDAIQEPITTKVWSQLVDWNGDGRVDVIDAKHGRGKTYWRVWLNEPASTSPAEVAWRAIDVDISDFRTYLLEHDLLDVVEQLSLDWFVDGRIAISRSKSWPRVRSYKCRQFACAPGAPANEACREESIAQECAEHVDYAESAGGDTITEWTVTDANGDGFPDLLANSGPTQVCVGDDAPPVEREHPITRDGSREYFEDHEPHTEDLRRVSSCDGSQEPWDTYPVAFLNRFGAFLGGDAEHAFGSPTRWSFRMHTVAGTTASPTTFERVSDVSDDYAWRHLDLADIAGEGLLRSRPAASPTQSLAVYKSDRARTCDLGGPATTTAQVAGEADLNGDGLLDRIESWQGRNEASTQWNGWEVRFNTGGGYGPARKIETHHYTPFALEEVKGPCTRFTVDGPRTVTVLLDLDADGLPDLVRASGGHLLMASLAPRESGEAGGVGRLTRIGNDRGATTTIRYANAKRDDVTTHQVPFPEIVVSSVETTLDDADVQPAPVHYRYGNASMTYDALAGRWAFSGYRWQLVLAGLPSRPGYVSGVLTAYDHAPPADPSAPFTERVVAGRLERVSRIEGEFEVARLAHALPPQTRPPFAATSFTYDVRVIGAIDVAGPEPLAAYDCGEMQGGALVAPTCRAGAIVYRAAIESWEGDPVITVHNTRAGSRIVHADAWGRPTEIHDRGDLRTTDDDTCTHSTYAPGPFPSVVTATSVTDCGLATVHQGGPQPPRTLTATRLAYDNLPVGQVGRGRLTARWIDRHDDQGFQGTFLDAAYGYDALGQIATVVSTRSLGSAATRTTTFTYDAFGASVISTTERASDVETTFTKLTQASTWPSRGLRSIDPSGVATVVDLDTFGRPVRAGVETDGHAWTLEQTTYDDDLAGRRVVTDTFPGNTPAGAEAAAADRQRTTTFLDSIGRARFAQTELGASYQHATLVSGINRRDALGRVVFAAAPFVADEIPFSPESVVDALHGTSTVFDRRGRVVRSVEAIGEQPTAQTTSVADRVYVSTATYGHDDGQAVVTTRGPDELDPQSDRAGHRDVAYLTATGRETRRVRLDPQHAAIDVVDQRWDRLGRVVRTTRYANPAAMSGPVVWTSRFDSLGNRLSLEEPGVSPRTTLHDEDGNPIETAWQDGGRRRTVRMTYDGLGRVTSRVLASIAVGEPPVIESTDHYHYDAHSDDAAQPFGARATFLGRLSWIDNPDTGRVFYGYDALGRADTEVHAYTGHAPVRQTSKTSVGGTLTALFLDTPDTSDELTYTYDSAGRLQSVRTPDLVLAEVLSITPLGQHGAIRYGNGVTDTFDYAPDGRRELLSSRSLTADGEYVFSSDARDAAGRIVKESHVSPTGSTSFTASYDALGRLSTRAQQDGVAPGLEAYGYDGLGNLRARLSTTGSGSLIHTPDAIDPDRLCHTGSTTAPPSTPCTFSYDGAGNVTLDTHGPSPRVFTYDAGNRIQSITRGAASVAFTYGPAGRVRTDVTGPDARTIWRFGALIEERTTPDGERQLERTIPTPLGANVSLRTRLSGPSSFTDLVVAHGDGRANLLFTRADGHVAQAPTYGPFGTVTSGATSSDPLTSTASLWNAGDHLPEVGITLLGPRAYDPDLARFLQRDPIAILSRSTTANPYAFAFSDPINLSDPTGLSPTGDLSDGPTIDPDERHLLVGGGLWGVLDVFTGSGNGSLHVFAGVDASSMRVTQQHVTVEASVEAAYDFSRGVELGFKDTRDEYIKWAKNCAAWRPSRCAHAVADHAADQVRVGKAFLMDPQGTAEAAVHAAGEAVCGQGCALGVGRVSAHIAQSIIGEQAIGVAITSVTRLLAAGQGATRLLLSAGTPLPKARVVRAGWDKFTASERAVAEYLEDLGRVVQKNPREGKRLAGRQGDAIVDGLVTEFKTVDATNPTRGSHSIRNHIERAARGKRQASQVVVDVRGSGITAAEARGGILDGLRLAGGKIDYASVIGDGYFIGYNK